MLQLVRRLMKVKINGNGRANGKSNDKSGDFPMKYQHYQWLVLGRQNSMARVAMTLYLKQYDRMSAGGWVWQID